MTNLKRFMGFLPYLVGFLGIVFYLSFVLRSEAQQTFTGRPPAAFAEVPQVPATLSSRLTQLSAHEWADLDQIGFYRESYTVDLSRYGGDSEYPVSAVLIVGGQQAAVSPEAQAKLRVLLAK